MLQSFQSIDPNRVWERILELVRDPSSNLVASLLVLAAAIIVVLMIVSIVIAAVSSWSSRQQRLRDIEELEALRYYLSVLAPDESEEDLGLREPEQPVTVIVTEPMAVQEWLLWLAAFAFFGLVLAVALGATTASSSVCVACHVDTPHTAAVKAGGTDAHAHVTCVGCHESSGPLGSATIEVPQRIAHFVNGVQTKPGPTQYGYVASSACYRCHRAIVRKTTVDSARGVRMAHRQPLDAGAQCLDCHTLATGVVSKVTVGMSSCLRCHDGKKQSTECSLCHIKDFSAATALHVNPADLKGQPLIATPDCGACHNMVKQCDPCHGGVRMPHSDLFKWWGHARKGAEDIWNTGGKECARCHYAGRRPCTKCHEFFPGHPSPAFAKLHAQTNSVGACTPCHDRKAYVATRNFCDLCHGTLQVTQ